jgi:putative CocE/NonD family hydrolase
MRVVTEFPHRVRVIEHTWITARDGCRLSAKIWLPEDADARPVPAILEYIPYRKRDFTAGRDALMHPYFAGHGYASVRVDCRGSGDSEGIQKDEYLQAELEDGFDVIAWLAQQSWCTGAVGMMGGSWGGFNSLQVAVLRPPALKAIITVVSTDDRYADDMHYMGGAVVMDMISWGQSFFAQTARPPDPAIFGEGWRAEWHKRLAELESMIVRWLRHQRRDAFWKHGSVCEDWNAIQCPVYAVGGWADGYSNAVFRMLAGLKVPRKGLVGPWGHGRPHFAVPGPQIGFLQECLRWWDHWLKGKPTGIMDEPMLRLWMQASVPPAPFYAERPGRWIAEAQWPSPNITTRVLPLGPGTLGAAPGAEAEMAICSPQSTGIAGGEWCPFGLGGVSEELPLDQRIDDGNSLVFDTAAVTETLEIAGAPVAELELAADRPTGLVSVRLSDLAPGGAATRVTYGVLNLTHRESHEAPAPLEPGKRYRVRVQLNDIAHHFPVGHRIRLAISSAYWPVIWPSPEATRLTLLTGASRLILPVRQPQQDDAALAPFAASETAPPPVTTTLRPGRIERSIKRNVASGEVEFAIHRDDGRTRQEATGTVLEFVKAHRYCIRDDDPASAVSEVTVTIKMERGDWRPEVRARCVWRGMREAFLVDTDLDVFDGETRIFCRSWADRIERDLV